MTKRKLVPINKHMIMRNKQQLNKTFLTLSPNAA